MEPGRPLRDLERAMLQQDPALDAPAVRTPASTLPLSLTPLVGRTAELADVARLFHEDRARLVTLTGPGGTGKTRLALAAAQQLEPGLAGGAVFVDLAGLTDPQLIGSVLADAIGLEGGDADAQLAALRDRGATLVVFDNFEHLLEGAPVVTRLLVGVPHLSVLATSRTPLRLSGEHVYAVPPLGLPPERAGADLETVMRSDAVQLFAQRARASAQITIDDLTAAPVAELCRRLDGLPLAIELAAMRCRTIPIDDMVGRIGQALDLLAEGPRDAPVRHRTLRATIDWSYRLLDGGQQVTFAQISVFAGGFDAAAAIAVVDPAADPALALPALIEDGLVQASAGRNGMLQTIREHAQERLRGADDEGDALARHRAHYLALAQRAADEIGAGHGDTATFAWYELEHDNLRAALASAAEQKDVATQVALAAAMRQFWIVRGHLSEGRRAFDQAIAASRTATPELLATALRVGGALSWRQGDAAEARERWTEAMGLYQELGDDGHIGACVAELGTVAWGEGDLDRAAALYAESTASFRRAGNSTRLAIALSNLSDIERGRGDLAAAAANAEQAGVIQRELGDVDGLAVTLHNHARVLLAAGDLDGCRRRLVESIEQARSIGYREVLAYDLECAAELALADGDAASGMRLLGASDHLFEQAEVPIAGPEAESRLIAAGRLQVELGHSAANKLHRAGAAADLHELLAETRRATLNARS
jgi:predicted ATPase